MPAPLFAKKPKPFHTHDSGFIFFSAMLRDIHDASLLFLRSYALPDAIRVYQKAVHPPSTEKNIPVVYFDASEARYTHAPTSSSGSPKRPIGKRFNISSP